MLISCSQSDRQPSGSLRTQSRQQDVWIPHLLRLSVHGGYRIIHRCLKRGGVYEEECGNDDGYPRVHHRKYHRTIPVPAQ